MKKSVLSCAVLLAFTSVSVAATLEKPLEGVNDFKDADVNYTTPGFDGYLSDGDTATTAGLLFNAQLKTTGDVTLENLREKGSGYVLGRGSSSIEANNVTLKADRVAVTGYGKHTITAKNNILITANGDAVQGTGDMYHDVTLTAGNDITIRSTENEAVQGFKTNFTITGKTVHLESGNNRALTQRASGTTTITAEEITVDGFTEASTGKYGEAVGVEAGTLKLNAKNQLTISSHGDKNAIGLTGGSLEVQSANATVNGDIAADKGELKLDGGMTFNGNKATIANLTGDKATFTVTKAEQKVAITNNNKALTVAGNGDVNDAVGIEGMDKIVKLDGNKEGVKVQMAEGMSSAASSAVLDKNGNLTNKQTVTNSILSNTVDIYAGSTLALNRIMMSDLRKRMGDLRATEDANGVWARYNGGKFSGARGLENKFTTIEVGADTAALVDGVRLGVALSYTDSESDMLRGKADMDAFSLAAYGTKFFDNGIYADVIGRIAKADTDVSVDGNKNGKMDNLAVSLSGELGWRFDLSKQIYIEPQTELTYTNIDSDTLKLSSGHEYKFDSVDSLIGRVGVATGFKCPNNKGDVYVRVSAVHEFLGDAKVTSGHVTHEVKGDDTWMEYGLGANFNINKNAYVYTELERSEGAALEQDWRANLGVRIAF